MPNLDRFSQPMSWEWEPRALGPDVYEMQDPILCACGCNQEIDLDDSSSYVESTIWEDEYIIAEPKHVTEYHFTQENDQLVGSQSK